MNDDAFYLPNRPTPPERSPRPLESLWVLRKDLRRKECGLFFHGESYGWEVQMRDDGQMVFGQRFIFREAAVREATDIRDSLEREGWVTD